MRKSLGFFQRHYKLKHLFFSLALIFILAQTAFTQKNDFDSRVFKGIDKIYNIKFDEADRIFKSLIADYPDHPAGKFFLAMIDWWRIAMDFDNESYDDNFFARLEDVIYQCDEILKKDPNNLDAIFFKGGSIGFRGRLRANRESWLKAADDGREAMPLLDRAYKIDPQNVDIQFGFGLYNYYASAIPVKYPFVKPLMVFFPKGDKAKGIAQLNNSAYNGKYTKTEAKYFLMTLYYQFEGDMYLADKYATELLAAYPDNPAFQRYKGRILLRRSDFYGSENVFRNILGRCNSGHSGFNKSVKREALYYIGYFAKINEKPDSAIIYLKQCTELSWKLDKKEQSGFLINAYLYLGMMNDKLGKREDALAYYNDLLKMHDYNGSREQAKKYIAAPFK
jgi:tetratricopeptide (TPR) repeat protein